MMFHKASVDFNGDSKDELLPWFYDHSFIVYGREGMWNYKIPKYIITHDVWVVHKLYTLHGPLFVIVFLIELAEDE